VAQWNTAMERKRMERDEREKIMQMEIDEYNVAKAI
jgi:hypothetical protein